MWMLVCVCVCVCAVASLQGWVEGNNPSRAAGLHADRRGEGCVHRSSPAKTWTLTRSNPFCLFPHLFMWDAHIYTQNGVMKAECAEGGFDSLASPAAAEMNGRA